MCGIAGALGIPRDAAEPAVQRMLSALRHRGPDDEGSVTLASPAGDHPPVVIGQTRLAIMDPTPAGHQPMADAPPTGAGPPNWIVFNGEVFNFRDLTPDLEHRGFHCRSRCDTEVILHAYRAWGEDCVDRFRGMFAWCLADAARGSVWLCRDRLGIKPLYLARPDGGGLLFASEVRALLAAGPDLVPPRLNPAALESFLAQGAVFGDESVVRGVELLPPSESLVLDWSGREVRRRTYWRLPTPGTAEPSDDRTAAVAEVGAALREAVGLRLSADVPVGVFLSSGIDSTAIATLAAEQAVTRLCTISIGFDQPEFDESAGAAAIAAELGTEHHALRLTGQDLLRDIPRALAAQDQPTVDGFNTFTVVRCARDAGLKVGLSGLGGDELFGGYASFRDVPRWVRARRWLWPLGPARRWLARGLRAVGRRGAEKIGAGLTRAGDPLHTYLLRRELFLPAERREWHDPPPDADPDSGVPLAALVPWTGRTPGPDLVNLVSSFELGLYMRHMLLRDADAFSMAHGFELRVPLLDHAFVGRVAALPGRLKGPGPPPKRLLVDAVGPRFPAVARRLPKKGFTFPWGAWFRGPLREVARDAAENRAVWKDLGVDPTAPGRLVRRFHSGDRRVSPSQVVAVVALADYARRNRLARV